MVEITSELMNEIKDQLIEDAFKWPLDKQFSMRLAKPDVWIITWFNPSQDTPKSHVIICSDCVLVIDATEVPYDFRSFIEKYISDKPIKVISTHAHMDHTLANWQFNDCEIFMSELAWDEIRRNRETEWTNPRQKYHKKGDYVPTIVKMGDTLHFGDREFEILDFEPTHSPTSLVFLDHTDRILFSGDEIDPGQVNTWGTPVEVFRDNMLRLKKRSDEFDIICPAHNGTPMSAAIIDCFIENCDRIMSGVEGDMDKASMSYLLNPFEPRTPEQVAQRRFDPEIRRSFWKGTAINYNINLIYRSQQEEYLKTHPNAKR